MRTKCSHCNGHKTVREERVQVRACVRAFDFVRPAVIPRQEFSGLLVLRILPSLPFAVLLI